MKIEEIPDTVNRKIRDRYQSMAETEVPNRGAPIIGLEAIKQKRQKDAKQGQISAPNPNLFCVNSLNGVEMTDYIKLPTKKSQQTEIVSMYHNEYDFETAWLLKCCYEEYIAGSGKVTGASLSAGIANEGSPFQPKYHYQFPVSSAAFLNAGNFYSSKETNLADGAIVYYAVKKLRGKLPALNNAANALAHANLDHLPPSPDRLRAMSDYQNIKFRTVDFRKYILLSYLQDVCKVKLDFVAGFGNDKDDLSVLRHRLPERKPEMSDKMAGRVERRLLWLYVQAERELLETHFLGAMDGDRSQDRDALLKQIQKKQEELGLNSEIFASTAYALTSSYAGYLMGLACLRQVLSAASEIDRAAWQPVIAKENAAALSVMQTLKSTDYLAVNQWKSWHHVFFHLDKATPPLSNAL